MSLESLRIYNKEGLEGQTRERGAPPSILWETLAQPWRKAHPGVWAQGSHVAAAGQWSAPSRPLLLTELLPHGDVGRPKRGHALGRGTVLIQ